MFRVLYNQAKIIYRLEPITGLLIKSGKESFDPTRPEMEFIRTWADVGGQVREVPFLPGSSIKGVVRSHTERILRTLDLRCCDITRRDGACLAGREDKKPPYKDHCFACRTFGYTTIASRVRFTDAFPWKPDHNGAEKKVRFQKVHFEQRPGVMINRRTGTVAHGPFDLEVITEGSFFGELTLRNYQLWQIALLALVLRDINEGHQRVGAMKSRGLGRVKIAIEKFQIEQRGALAQPDSPQIRGIGAIEHLVSPYDLILDDAVSSPDCFKHEGETTLSQIFVPNGMDHQIQIAWHNLSEAIFNSNHWRRFLQKKGG